MVACLDLKIENDEKEYQILIVFYDFEKLKGYLLSMNYVLFCLLAVIGSTDFI